MKKIALGGLTVLFALGGGIIYKISAENKWDKDEEVIVYQSRTCGCCKKWINHLERSGFNVSAHYVDDVRVVKAEYNIPRELGSCHTAFIGGYVVEGHVPAAAVKKLLSEKPNVKGIAVPGMPIGSPGMEGSYKEAYDVLAFDDQGVSKVYMSF